MVTPEELEMSTALWHHDDKLWTLHYKGDKNDNEWDTSWCRIVEKQSEIAKGNSCHTCIVSVNQKLDPSHFFFAFVHGALDIYFPVRNILAEIYGTKFYVFLSLSFFCTYLFPSFLSFRFLPINFLDSENIFQYFFFLFFSLEIPVTKLELQYSIFQFQRSFVDDTHFPMFQVLDMDFWPGAA